MNAPFARYLIALSATMVPDSRDRALGVLYLALQMAEEKRPTWWRWTVWLAGAITVVRIERTR